MIRHVALFDLRDGADLAQIEEAFALIRQLDPGIRAASWGPDAGLREGNAGYTSVWDFADEAAYWAWDTHPEHERARRELILPNVAGVRRGQFRIDPATS
ncbi:MAG TPA: Dabb family protein [Acidimicrobiia bacterium]|nr:Dabb family protein [Acidimicrobiia bacterium]